MFTLNLDPNVLIKAPTCSHDWVLTDDGAGTIVKAHNKFIWGHKASILVEYPLDTVAVSDASTHDGETFFIHVIKALKDYPILSEWIETVLYDSACDSFGLKEKFLNDVDITLKASINPRRKKDVIDQLPKCKKMMTPYGTLICKGGHEMDYKVVKYDREMFIYAPVKDGAVVCHSCDHKETCCPNATQGRTTQIPFEMLPHINPTEPPMAKRFKAIMTRRPSDKM